MKPSLSYLRERLISYSFNIFMTLLPIFKKVAFAEGVSNVLLFFVAMPLKYFADMPLAVTYVGWVHGLLFVLYIGIFFALWPKMKWPFWKASLIGGASLIPFATFWVDKKYL